MAAVDVNLRLEQTVIERMKEYAKSERTSLSRMVENYFISLLNKARIKEEVREITPFVAKLNAGITVPADFDYKKDRAEYLDKKYGSNN
ncbi:hypothetical protein FACS1894199_17960 [Bacteroidia bacterium]|nr:hypothetical protein FACS1894199_17960 [Bacteroidia bacterium]